MYDLIKPILFKLEPELAHSLAEYSLKGLEFIHPALLNLLANKYVYDDDMLKQELLGLFFANPVGIAGGFDKNANILKGLCALGFGFLEFGTVTPLAQKGNDKPRLFRLIKEESLQNAMGSNNKGKAKVLQNLKKSYPFVLPIGANIGKNKDTSNENALQDYLNLLSSFNNFCDYFTINISSPNTKNLRTLQNKDFLSSLLKEAKNLSSKPIFIKIAPDLKQKEALTLCEDCLKDGVSGFIIANTSTDYSLLDNNRTFGGLSGQIIKEKSSKFFKALAKEFFKDTVLISSGGIDSANEAYDRIKNGASLVQIYTALVFKGPSLIRDINKGLCELLKKDKFLNIQEAVGANIK